MCYNRQNKNQRKEKFGKMRSKKITFAKNVISHAGRESGI